MNNIEQHIKKLIKAGKCFEAGQLIDSSNLPEIVKMAMYYDIEYTPITLEEVVAFDIKLKEILTKYSDANFGWKEIRRDENIELKTHYLMESMRWHEFIKATKPLERECRRLYGRLQTLQTTQGHPAITILDPTIYSLICVYNDALNKNRAFDPWELNLRMLNM
jgi:hypothetical protein